MIFGRRKDTRVPDTDPVYLTKEGLANLKKHVERVKQSLPSLAAEAGRTAAYGDRSDNAAYKEAKSALRKANAQILSAEDKLRRAVLIKPNDSGIVQIGSTVTLKSAEGEKTFRIVGSVETNPRSGRISNKSPIGAALLGKKIGEIVIIETPGGKKEYKIIKIT